MLKLWDFECTICGTVAEYMVEGSPLVVDDEACKACDTVCTLQRILIARFAKYTGEGARSDFNPEIHGGQFDTMGQRELPRLPELKGVAEVETKMRSEIAKGADARDVADRYQKDLPSAMDYKTLFSKPEWREVKKERTARKAENAAKRTRAKLVKKGETTMRDMPLPGDPKALHRKGA